MLPGEREEDIPDVYVSVSERGDDEEGNFIGINRNNNTLRKGKDAKI